MPIPENAARWCNSEDVLDAKDALVDLVRYQPEKVIDMESELGEYERAFLQSADYRDVACTTSRIQGTTAFELISTIEGVRPFEDLPSAVVPIYLTIEQDEVRRLSRRHRNVLVNHVFAIRRQRLIDALERIEGWSPNIEKIEKRLEKLEAGYAGMIESFVLARGSE